MLPLELVFEDFNDVEKVASLGRSLSLRGVPDADAPRPGEIGYYAPSQSFVLYYDSPGRWPGLVRMGRFDYDLNELRDLPDGTGFGSTRSLRHHLTEPCVRPWLRSHSCWPLPATLVIDELTEFPREQWRAVERYAASHRASIGRGCDGRGKNAK
jgi:hypothetical protein